MKDEREEAIDKAHRQVDHRETETWTWEEIRALIGE